MLILTRKVGETILIGDRIAVVVTQITPHTVRIGIEAPPETQILREEISLGVVSEETEDSRPEPMSA